MTTPSSRKAQGKSFFPLSVSSKVSICGLPLICTAFVDFVYDKPIKGVHLKKYQEVVSFHGEPMTITFERGDKLNG